MGGNIPAPDEMPELPNLTLLAADIQKQVRNEAAKRWARRVFWDNVEAGDANIPDNYGSWEISCVAIAAHAEWEEFMHNLRALNHAVLNVIMAKNDTRYVIQLQEKHNTSE